MHQKCTEETIHCIQQLTQLHFFPWLRNQSFELENIPGTRNPGRTHTDVNDWNALIMVGCLAENQFWSNYKSFWINSCMPNAARLAKSTVCGGGSSAAQNQENHLFTQSTTRTPLLKVHGTCIFETFIAFLLWIIVGFHSLTFLFWHL